MDADERAQAESRLEQEAAVLGLADPRPALRARLRELRDLDAAAFGRAVAHYEQVVVPALAGADPVAAWLDYGRFVGQLTSAGTLTAIDGAGRATGFAPPLAPATLVLFVPDDLAVAPLVAAAPLQPTPAQRATLDLLVHRRLTL
jgi:hypothetical protein